MRRNPCRTIFLLPALFIFIAGAAAQGKGAVAARLLPSIDSLVGRDLAVELAEKGKILKTSVDSRPSFLPHDASTAGIAEEIETRKPGILVETLFLLKRVAPRDAAAEAKELLRIHALMRSFSSLAGIQYYSITHGKMRTLYAESYAIDGPATRRRLPDPSAPPIEALDETQSFYVMQRDLSFGSNVYSYLFEGFPGAVRVRSTNVTTMSIAFIPVMQPGVLVSRLVIVQAREGILFYVESDANTAGFLAERIGESFANRATALFGWFESRFAALAAKGD